jgi:hypothetical protein
MTNDDIILKLVKEIAVPKPDKLES